MLLLYRIGSRVVQPSWCNISGHFEEFELNNSKACALREVFEETGIEENDITNLKLKYVTLRNKNNEIRQSYYFFADLNNKDIHLKDCDEGILEWVEIREVLEKDNNSIFSGVATEKQVVFTELNEF